MKGYRGWMGGQAGKCSIVPASCDRLFRTIFEDIQQNTREVMG